MRGEPEARELLEDSQEAYFSAHPAAGGGPVYLALLVALCGAGVALPLVSVDVTARASGILRPEVEQHRVAAGAAGLVSTVGARLGERVRAGDLLLSLRSDALLAELAAVDSARAAARVRHEELTELIDLADALAESGAPAAGGRSTSDRSREERARLVREWSALAGEVAPALAEARRTRALAARDLVAPAEVDRAELRLAQARAAPRLLAARERVGWAAEQASVRESLRRVEAEAARVRAQARLADVRAPVAGTIESLTWLSPGSWVAAGQEVAVISPDASLVAEVYVESRQVGRIRRGMPVRLLVDAFDHHEWGALPAVVRDVADDATIVAGRPQFRVRCTPLARALHRPGGAAGRPGKGMSVTASFRLGRRSLLRLLLDRVSAAVEDRSPAAEEP